MTRQDRLSAFQMRLNGKSWGQIADALGYEYTSVYLDMNRVLQRGVRRLMPVIYPRLREYIIQNCEGSTARFARRCGVSPNTMYCALSGAKPVSAKTARTILRETGLTFEQAFATAQEEEESI